MSADDAARHADLSRAWDAIVGGGPAPLDLPDPELTATIRELHRLNRRLHPRPAFVDRLEDDLMNAGVSIEPTPRTAAAPMVTRPAEGRWQPTGPFWPTRRVTPRRRWMPNLAAAAVLLLTFAAGYVSYRLVPPPAGGTRPTVPIAATLATPVVAAEGTECAVPAASLDRLALSGTPSTASIVPIAQPQKAGPAVGGWPALAPAELPSDRGQPADAAVRAGIEATVRELVACMVAEDAERTSALFTDDYWRRYNNLVETVPFDQPPVWRELPRTFVPLGDRAVGLPPTVAVSDVRQQADGRVTALLTQTTPALSSVFAYDFFVFAREGERWLIDEAVPVAEFPKVEVVVRDGAYEPSAITLAVDSPVRFVVRNAGTARHSFVIRELLVRIEVAPGEVGEAVGLPVSGAYEYYSDLPGDLEDGMRGILTSEWLDTEDPAGLGEVRNDGPLFDLPLASLTISIDAPANFTID